MVESFECKGTWFLPQNPDRSVTGHLRYAPEEGVILELDGILSADPFAETDPNIAIILGISVDGRWITVANAYTSGMAYNLTGKPTSTIRGYMLLVGAHFTEPSDIRFKEVSVRFNHLEDWVAISSLQMEVQAETERPITVRAGQLPSIISKIDEDRSISLRFGSSVQNEAFPMMRVVLEHRSEVVFVSQSEQVLEDVLADIYHFQNFLTLGVGRVCTPISIEGMVQTIERDDAKVNGSKGLAARSVPVKIMYVLRHRNGRPERIQPMRMMFTYRDLQDNFETALRRWFASCDRIGSTHALYFGLLQEKIGIVENRFLNLAQALEVYHRRTFPNEQIAATDHEKRVGHVLARVPNEHRSWVADRLKYGNEPNLRKRFKELLKMCPDATDLIIKGTKDFIHRVVDTRNHLTHHSEPRNLLRKDLRGLYDLSEKLFELTRICLLREVGFTCAQITTILNRYNRFHAH